MLIPLHLSQHCEGVRLLSQSASPPSTDQYVSSASLSEEKTQLVLNVDKQLEEVRELVCLWSLIFHSFDFLNNEFGVGENTDNITCVIWVVTWYTHTHISRVVSSVVAVRLCPDNSLLCDTPLTYFKMVEGVFTSHLLEWLKRTTISILVNLLCQTDCGLTNSLPSVLSLCSSQVSLCCLHSKWHLCASTDMFKTKALNFFCNLLIHSYFYLCHATVMVF